MGFDTVIAALLFSCRKEIANEFKYLTETHTGKAFYEVRMADNANIGELIPDPHSPSNSQQALKHIDRELTNVYGDNKKEFMLYDMWHKDIAADLLLSKHGKLQTKTVDHGITLRQRMYRREDLALLKEITNNLNRAQAKYYYSFYCESGDELSDPCKMKLRRTKRYL